MQLLAGIINSGFQAEHEYMELRFNEMRTLLDVRKTVEDHERKLKRIAEALRIEL